MYKLLGMSFTGKNIVEVSLAMRMQKEDVLIRAFERVRAQRKESL